MPVVRSHWPVVGPGGVVSFTANGGTLVFVHPTDPALARVALILRWAVPARRPQPPAHRPGPHGVSLFCGSGATSSGRRGRWS